MSSERPLHIPLPASLPLKSAMKQVPTPQSTSSSPGSPLLISSTPLHLSQSFAATPTGSLTSSILGGTGSGYLPKVSFDTFENPAAQMFSYTLQVKSEGYRRNRNTRVFLCAASADESGSEALDWTLESLVQDGDELIVFRGFDVDELENDHDMLREEAKELMRQIQQKNVDEDRDRKLSIIVEFIAGKVTHTIERLIALYRPDSLIVGTRGLSGVKVFGAAFGGMGSVSKYCLSRSPVPVIVVRPERKVRKTIQKRRADPKRGRHFEESSPGVGPISKSPNTT